jgi:hypothetical protein
MCFKIPIINTKPAITFYEIDARAVKDELDDLGIDVPLGLWDGDGSYYYTTEWGIREAVKYCRKIYPFPKYEYPRFDCDDFAVLMKGLMSAKFGINACAIALGAVPNGYHAYNICRAEQGWVMIEPQTGEVFEFGGNSYQCDRAIL